MDPRDNHLLRETPMGRHLFNDRRVCLVVWCIVQVGFINCGTLEMLLMGDNESGCRGPVLSGMDDIIAPSHYPLSLAEPARVKTKYTQAPPLHSEMLSESAARVTSSKAADLPHLQYGVPTSQLSTFSTSSVANRDHGKDEFVS